ncbi:uncharacterized protein LOC135461847 isoform X2 [Liolophura sinensis]|uniref:uncharacterized protein LOC135461847 isoform X2 n=1 Tax=Liolophura sinensis TaxID=3198878 RepID=UPI0031580E4D
MAEKEEVVMTPSKKGKATHIKIERVKKLNLDKVAHVAGGQHKGLVINKEAHEDDPTLEKPQLQLGFICFLVDQKTGGHAVESRKLKFWYRDDTEYLDQVTTAYEFFKELVKPENFPRDYVGFIKKCMKQMQDEKYHHARKVDVELEQLSDEEAPLSPGGKIVIELGFNKEDTRSQEEIVREKILQVLESAYPNILVVEDIIRIINAPEALVYQLLRELQDAQLVQEMENGGFVRHVLDEQTEVQMVKQMPTIAANQQPTVAIISAMYYEKLAVDAMMENKTSYMRFKMEGESNVYTIGYIGEHKVVSTKLPAVGFHRAAQIATGNTTTRLLGTFQNVEHVFLVGVAGGVPHYTDYYKHVRLGDVVLSKVDPDNKLYYFCNKVTQDKAGNPHFINKSWSPRDPILQQVASRLQEMNYHNPDFAPWERYMAEGEQLLAGQQVSFSRPEPNTDRLYMDIGDQNIIEVQHPMPPDGVMPNKPGVPAFHFGTIGSGRPVVKSHSLRLDFAARYDVRAFDTAFDQVLDSIEGNRKDSYMIVRGIADYVDGDKHKEWQPYAALAAAAYTKTMIKALSNPQMDDY